MYGRSPRADAERVAQVLAGLGYPAAKWQILMHAETYGADACTRAELWALPAGEYAGLHDVLLALSAPLPPPRAPGPAPRVAPVRPLR